MIKNVSSSKAPFQLPENKSHVLSLSFIKQNYSSVEMMLVLRTELSFLSSVKF